MPSSEEYAKMAKLYEEALQSKLNPKKEGASPKKEKSSPKKDVVDEEKKVRKHHLMAWTVETLNIKNLNFFLVIA